MDSRVKKMTVGICVSAILFLTTLVCVINYLNGNWDPSQGKKESVQKNPSNNVAEVDATHSEEDLHAFLEDDKFFDEEMVEAQIVDAQNYVRVTMSLNSVYRDIRIQIIDSNSERVEGVPFTVSVTSLGSYTDTDQDGIIWIQDCEPGDYKIQMQEVDGYRVPLAAINLYVTDAVSFSYIRDIDIMMKSADEINEQAEDAYEHFADSDSTERLDYLATDEKDVKFGIDLSSHNGNIDWSQVQTAGVDFVYLRCGYRGLTTGALVEDSKFRENVEEAIALGLNIGVYFRSQAITELEAIEEASMVVKLCREYAISYPIFIESASAFGSDDKQGRADALSVSDRTSAVNAFCETIESAGYRSGVMATTSWLDKELKMDILKKYYVYLAEYKETPSYKGSYTFWRYSENGWINGVTGRVGVICGYYNY